MSTYAISDLHGRSDLYQEVKKILRPDDTVYCLGDCGDRGPDGWKLIKEVMSDPRFIYLKGNHEDLLIGAMLEYLCDERVNKYYERYPGCYNSMAALSSHNGGAVTLNGWIQEGSNSDWITVINKLPLEAEYINKDGVKVLLSHAGFTPSKKGDDFSLMWDRHHFHDTWDSEKDGKNVVIVHGHTPCELVANKLNMVFGPEHRYGWAPFDGTIWYNEHKIDIDMGSYYTGYTVLLDLDTFDEHIFYMEED